MKNAQITDTDLGFEDHGILTYYLYLSYGDGRSQGFGGYSLSGEYTSKTIEGILKTVGVENWEDMKGKFIRVAFIEEKDSFNSRIKSIGHITEDRWFDPEEIKSKK